MDDRIKKAFDQIRADEVLKERTRASLARRHAGRRRTLPGRLRTIAALACLALMLLTGWGGYQVYFTPTSIISIDVNPSVELGVNRFGRVVTVNGYNRDGEALAAALDVRFMDYAEALSRILDSEAFAAYEADDAVVLIAVLDADEARGGEMLARVESCTAGRQNTHCLADDMDAAQYAHEAGLSYGKYRAYLALSELDPSVTPDEVRDMSMRAIRDQIAALSDGNAAVQTEHTGGGQAKGYRHQARQGAG